MARKLRQLLFLPDLLPRILDHLALLLDTLVLLITALFLGQEFLSLLLLLLLADGVLCLTFIAFEYLELLLANPLDIFQEELLELELNHGCVEVFFQIVLFGLLQTDVDELVVHGFLKNDDLVAELSFVLYEDVLLLLNAVDHRFDFLDHFVKLWQFDSGLIFLSLLLLLLLLELLNLVKAGLGLRDLVDFFDDLLLGLAAKTLSGLATL